MIEDYINAILTELITIMKSLGEKKELWGILFMMTDKENYPLKDIAKWFPTLSKNVIREKFLKPLVSAGLIQHHAHSLVEIVDYEGAYYKVSHLCERVLKVMEYALEIYHPSLKHPLEG